MPIVTNSVSRGENSNSIALKSVIATRLLREISEEAGSQKMMEIVMCGLGDTVHPGDQKTYDALSRMNTDELIEMMKPFPYEIDPRSGIEVDELDAQFKQAASTAPSGK
jgi:hypothetical protein